MSGSDDSGHRAGGNTGTPGDSGSRGYQAGSAGYRTSTEIPQSGNPGREPGQEPAGGGESQLDRLMAEAEVERRRREERRSPALWMPGEDHLDREPEPSDRTEFTVDDYLGRGSRQLGLRLRPQHFERLCQAAEVYGVRPTTLARMMVIRGVNAIIDAELARAGEMLRGE